MIRDAMRFKALLAAGILVASVQPALAMKGTCVLRVGGRSYIDGSCNIVLDRDGTFAIGTYNSPQAQYFAFVGIVSPGVAEGYWSGPAGDGRMHERLGQLRRDGACWRNQHAEICAYR